MNFSRISGYARTQSNPLVVPFFSPFPNNLGQRDGPTDRESLSNLLTTRLKGARIISDKCAVCTGPVICSQKGRTTGRPFATARRAASAHTLGNRGLYSFFFVLALSFQPMDCNATSNSCFNKLRYTRFIAVFSF